MRWIILLLIVACGKHEEPHLKDVRDSDGDQILNYQEEGAGKYLANFDLPKKISGRIKLQALPEADITFSNDSDLKEKALAAIAQERTFEDERFFSEFFDLNLQKNKNFDFNSNFNTVHLYFDQLDLKAEEVILSHPSHERTLGRWHSHMKIILNREELSGLFKGSHWFRIKKSFPSSQYFQDSKDETIRKKTYKVFFSDGITSKVLYASKELTLNALKQALNISDSREVIGTELFFNSLEESSEQWFHRIHLNGHVALVKMTLQDLRERFLQGLGKKSFTLLRQNGQAGAAVALNAAPGATVYLKIRPIKSIRSFHEYTESKKYRTGGGYHGHNTEWNCIFQMRRISSETLTTPILEEFLNNLSFKIAAEENFSVLEQIDEKGIFWEIAFKSESESIGLALNNSPASSFTVTGQYGGWCDDPYKNPWVHGQIQTNVEGYLKFEIESYVEKIQERP